MTWTIDALAKLVYALAIAFAVGGAYLTMELVLDKILKNFRWPW